MAKMLVEHPELIPLTIVWAPTLTAFGLTLIGCELKSRYGKGE